MTQTKRPQRPDGRKARTRAALVEAAAKLFAERGVDQTTVDDIAEAAGVSVGSLYVHFGSKDALLLVIIDQAIELHAAYMSTEIEADTALGRVLRAGDSYLRFALSEPVAFRFTTMQVAEQNRGPVHDEANKRIVARVQQVLESITADLKQAMDDGEIMQTPIAEAMVFLWGAWSGVATLVLRDDALAVPRDLAQRAIVNGRKTLVRGLGGNADIYGDDFSDWEFVPPARSADAD